MMAGKRINPKYSPRVREKLAVKRKEERRLAALKQIAQDKQKIKRSFDSESNSTDSGSKSKLTLKGEGEEDGPMDPLGIIHEEAIWEEILEYLVDFNDVKSAYHSCLLFNHLLERKVVKELFPEVLSVLSNKHYLCFNEAIDKSAILNLRLASRTWKDLVDKIFFEDKYCNQDWYIQYLTSAPLINPVKTFEKFDSAISSLQESQVLFTRELALIDPDPEEFGEDELDRFHAGVINLLEICGDSIWALVYQTRRSFSAAYICVREWCIFLPNLKSLRVNNLRDFNQDHAYVDEVVRIETVNLLGTVRLNPFPTLPYLQHYEEQNIPCSFSAAILNANRDIKSVMVSEINFEIGQIIMPLRLDRLSMYKFRYQTSTYFITNPWQNPFYWPLKKISLRNFREDGLCKVEPLFSFLKIYKNCLEELEVDLDVEDNLSKLEYLELPKLKFLRWRLSVGKQVRFMTPLESLEILKLVISSSVKNVSSCCSSSCSQGQSLPHEVQRRLSEKGFDSISWDEFPSLKELTFENRRGAALRTFMRP